MPKPTPLTAGQAAPSFKFLENGKDLTIGQLDSPVLVYFYPKDDTPGCTTQACGIRDAWSQFETAELRVVGVSKDDEVSHEKFTQKYDLPFPLVADTDLSISLAFGVYGEKKFMGKTYDSVHRMSFLIDSEGTILKSYPKVKPNEHAEAVLKDLAAFAG